MRCLMIGFLLSLLLAGCGGSSGTDGDAPADGDTTTDGDTGPDGDPEPESLEPDTDPDPADGDPVDGRDDDVSPACSSDSDCPSGYDYCRQPSGSFQPSGECDTLCGIGHPCPPSYVCSNGSGRCLPIEGFCTSSLDCPTPARQFCDMPSGQASGVCRTSCWLPGEGCPELYRCNEETGACDPVAPALPCTSDQECPEDHFCFHGAISTCVRYCSDHDHPCPALYECSPDGRCIIPGWEDLCGPDCPPWACTPYGCMYNECPACPMGECCDALTAPLCVPCVCENPPVCGLLLAPCCPGYHCTAIAYGMYGFCEEDGGGLDGDDEMDGDGDQDPDGDTTDQEPACTACAGDAVAFSG